MSAKVVPSQKTLCLLKSPLVPLAIANIQYQVLQGHLDPASLTLCLDWASCLSDISTDNDHFCSAVNRHHGCPTAILGPKGQKDFQAFLKEVRNQNERLQVPDEVLQSPLWLRYSLTLGPIISEKLLAIPERPLLITPEPEFISITSCVPLDPEVFG